MNVPYGFGSFDRVAFKLINRVWTHPALDALMPAITDLQAVPWFRYGLLPALLGLWLWKGRARALRVLVVAALAVAACDMLAYRVLKPWVARPRPQYAGIGAIVRAPSGGTMGFPSNHAANTAAAAAVLAVAYPAGAMAFWAVAGLTAYSRVYCGVHYPGDVAAGLLLGGLLSWPWAVLMLAPRSSGGGKTKKR
ncbi:MAG: phosphatase PAP2 family protein [Elusimicrobiota bacterium]